MTAVLPAPDPPRPNAPTAIAGGRTRVADAIVPRIADAILSDPPLCHVTFTTIWASRAVSRSLCETRRSHITTLNEDNGWIVSVVTAKRLDASRITGGTHLIVRQPRVLGRCSPFGRREFWHRRSRPRERSPTVLAKYSHRKDRQGFPWPFERLRRVALARESSGRSRCCSRRHWRRASRARCWPPRRLRTSRPPPPWPRRARISCSIPKPPSVPPRLKAGTPSQFPAGRSPAACHRRPLWHPGISGNRQILAGQPRQSLRRRCRRYRETRSADVRHAECALRHRRLAWRHQDQRRGTHRSVHGRKRANSRHRRDRACRETGEACARLPASGRHGSRGRDAGPGDDHPDDHPHRLEWPRRAADRI